MDRYDLLIFGATGFTGNFIVKCLVESGEKVRFAICGRNEAKLRAVIELASIPGQASPTVDIILADLNDYESLLQMASKTRVIINAVGPYRLYGESVVKASLEGGAHYVDICGEPAFLELMQYKYDEVAKTKGLYLVGSCGWDSLICDLGIDYLKGLFNNRLGFVETFAQLDSGSEGYSIHAGTYRSLLLSLSKSKQDNLRDIRRKIMPVDLPKDYKAVIRRPAGWYDKRINGWCMQFLGSDKSVVKRSQYYNFVENGIDPTPVETYVRVNSVFYVALIFIWFTLLNFFSKFEAIWKVIYNNPGLFSLNFFTESGPSVEQINKSSFIYWFFGYENLPNKDVGPNEKISRKVILTSDGPDAGYVATSGCVLAAALTLLNDTDQLPKRGGVFTPAVAFGKTNIYKRLEKFDITYKVVSDVITNEDRCFL